MRPWSCQETPLDTVIEQDERRWVICEDIDRNSFDQQISWKALTDSPSSQTTLWERQSSGKGLLFFPVDRRAATWERTIVGGDIKENSASNSKNTPVIFGEWQGKWGFTPFHSLTLYSCKHRFEILELGGNVRSPDNPSFSKTGWLHD